jgi:hypothetical protein
MEHTNNSLNNEDFCIRILNNINNIVCMFDVNSSPYDCVLNRNKKNKFEPFFDCVVYLIG